MTKLPNALEIGLCFLEYGRSSLLKANIERPQAMKLCVIFSAIILSSSVAIACENGHHASKTDSASRTVSFVSEANAAETTMSRFKIAKMSCESCQTKIESSLKKIDGIETLTFDLKKKIMTVSYQTSKVSTAQITSALTEAGFPGTAL